MWYKNLFVAPVRISRYTHSLLEIHGEFTVFVPSGDMKQAIGICGTASGRDTDKFAACGLKLAASKAVQSPHIEAPGTVIECCVVYKTDFENDALDDTVRTRYYSGNDEGNMHTLYFGEILAIYEQS
jgi:flavin reductase (DIM6/NTAB) family NADH-FMN oxidoreductase RutF